MGTRGNLSAARGVAEGRRVVSCQAALPGVEPFVIWRPSAEDVAAWPAEARLARGCARTPRALLVGEAIDGRGRRVGARAACAGAPRGALPCRRSPVTDLGEVHCTLNARGPTLARVETGGGDSCRRACRIIDVRIDAFVVAYVVELDRDGRGPIGEGGTRSGLLRALSSAARLARKHGRGVAFRWGSLDAKGARIEPWIEGELRPPTRPGMYTIENDECTIRIDRTARETASYVPGADEGAVEPAWNVEIEWRALSLATRGYDPHLSKLLASRLGRVKAERTRRVDPAVTLTGFDLRAEDTRRLVLRSRAKVDEWDAIDGERRQKVRGARKTETIAQHGTRARRTGFTVSPGNPVLCRVYDKLAELRVHGDLGVARASDLRAGVRAGDVVGRTPKGSVELGTWKRAGVDPNRGHDVTRVEYQLRGEALDQLDLRNPYELEAKIQSVWTYLTGEAGAEGQAARRKKSRAEMGRARRRLAWRKKTARTRGTRRAVEEVRGNVGTSHPATRQKMRRRRRARKGMIARAAFARKRLHKGWMRLVVRERAKGARARGSAAAVDPRWAVVRRARFPKACEATAPARRNRALRRGADYRQVWGAGISHLAASLAMPPVAPHVHHEDGHALAPEEYIAAISDGACERFVLHHSERIFRELGEQCATRLLADKGARGAAEWLMVRAEGARARHAQIAFDSWAAARRRRVCEGEHPIHAALARFAHLPPTGKIAAWAA